MNENAYNICEKYQFYAKCTKLLIKQFQFCENVAKNIFIKYPKNMFFMLEKNFSRQRTEIAL